MLKLGAIRWRGKCSKHPGYDPRIEGRGAIRGGCERCGLLADINELHGKMIRLMRGFSPPQPPKKRDSEPSAQANLFSEP